MGMVDTHPPATLEEYVTKLHSWYSQESIGISSMGQLLTAMSMLPSFFTQVPSITKFSHINGSPWVECLRLFTASVRSFDLSKNPAEPCWQWMETSVLKLMTILTKSHAASYAASRLADNGKEADRFPCPLAPTGLTSSWCSMAITSELYLTVVLGLWNAGNPIDRRLFRIIISILTRDLKQQPEALSVISNLSDFLLWKYFIGAYSLAWHQCHEFDDMICEAQGFFDRSIQIWSEAHNIRQWEHAQRRLSKIAWPDDKSQALAKEVWAKAIGKPQRASKPKVRTGCVTCKIRHVKCDELKPSCQRCMTAGITCEGYKEATYYKKSKVIHTRASATLVPLLPKLEPSL